MIKEPASSERRGQESRFSLEEEIEPLSNCPYFSVILTKSQVNSPYQLVIPSKITGYLPKRFVHVVLSRQGKIWEMGYHGEATPCRRFTSGWKNFVLDNKLKVGDACVFELMECNDEIVKFKVQVLRGGLPEEILEKINSVGESSNTPIVIDD